MNYFTKEELMDLKRAVLWVDIDHDIELANKIQMLIDNYCDHKNTDDCKSCNSIICEHCNKAIL